MRERREDIPLLAQYFLRKYALAMKRPVIEIDIQALTALQAYNYPGNVRELENAIERGVALGAENKLRLQELPEGFRDAGSRVASDSSGALPSLEAQEAEYIRWVLGQTKGNRTQAAQILGIDRVSLWRKLKKYDLAKQWRMHRIMASPARHGRYDEIQDL